MTGKEHLSISLMTLPDDALNITFLHYFVRHHQFSGAFNFMFNAGTFGRIKNIVKLQ